MAIFNRQTRYFRPICMSPKMTVWFVTPTGLQEQQSGMRLQADLNQPQNVAVLGGGLGGILAATVMAEESEACFAVLPLQEVVAYFAHPDAKSHGDRDG